MIGQSKLWSFIEVNANMALGFCLAWLTSVLVLPLFFGQTDGIIANSFWITIIFTMISYVRNFVVRRVFNNIEVQRNNETN